LIVFLIVCLIAWGGIGCGHKSLLWGTEWMKYTDSMVSYTGSRVYRCERGERRLATLSLPLRAVNQVIV